MDKNHTDLAVKNRRAARAVFLTVAVMIGLSFASVPLYNLFCRVTGFGGTTQITIAPPTETLDRTVTVRFDSTTATDLPWHFGPQQRSVTVRLGEKAHIAYNARNTGNTDVTGTALHNVTPEKVGKYFHKMECFCFNDHTLKPGENSDLPVTFYVDPAMDKDPNMADVEVITLSYTFFKVDSPALEKAMEDLYNQPAGNGEEHEHEHTHETTSKEHDSHGRPD